MNRPPVALPKLKFFLCLLVCFVPMTAAVLPAGSDIEVRLLNPVGSRVSHVGDAVRAVIIAPVSSGGKVVLSAGATVSGAISHVERLGLGLRHTAATLDIQFTEFDLPNAAIIPIQTRVASIEEAREIVSENGTVIGIHPTVSFSTGVSTALALLFIGEPELRIPALGFKFLAARSPDAEITFPAGTEMLLRLTREAQVPALWNDPSTVPLLTAAEGAHAQDLLNKLPHQQTQLDKKHSSDVINVALVGTRQAVERAFRAAGWSGTDAHGVMALYHMYHCMVQRAGYSRAPMTALKLNSSPPDTSFQKGLDTFAKRHHVRLWQDKQTGLWLAAATEDVKYEVRAMHLTHGTDHQVDNERAKIVNDLIFTGCVSQGGLVPRPALKVIQENRHAIVTDGDIALLALNSCENPRGMPANPQKAPPIRAIQAAVAVAEDIARSNPFAVLHGLTKAMLDSSQPKDQFQPIVACPRAIAISRIGKDAPAGILALR